MGEHAVHADRLGDVEVDVHRVVVAGRAHVQGKGGWGDLRELELHLTASGLRTPRLLESSATSSPDRVTFVLRTTNSRAPPFLSVHVGDPRPGGQPVTGVLGRVISEALFFVEDMADVDAEQFDEVRVTRRAFHLQAEEERGRHRQVAVPGGLGGLNVGVDGVALADRPPPQSATTRISGQQLRPSRSRADP